ncbi:MAG: tRNA guanosine(34) transglycosylase Tgt [bacterium]
MSIKFTIEKKLDGKLGRAGMLETPHGVIETPAFVVVGTKATVKSLSTEQVKEAGTQVVLANTYHLYLQPGDELVKKMGGLGKMMNWGGPTMTDSGGFQVFSLGAAYKKGISKVIQVTDPSLMIPERFDDSDAPRLAKIGQDGVSFTSHLDGSVHYITPEKSIQIQHNLGADMIFAFDECTSPSEDLKYQEEALERTHAWALRSLSEHIKLNESGKRSLLEEERLVPRSFSEVGSDGKGETLRSFQPALFGIVQGGRDERLRKKSAKVISEMEIDGKGFDGFGIGGSFAKEDMSTAVKWVNEILPEEKPRHLLGIGEPEDLFMGIESGVDLFDCVLPTRNGRNGTLFTKDGKMHIEKSEFRGDVRPIENDCECYTCKNYSRGYIAHLFHGKEMLAGTLSSIHNVHFLVNLVKKIRQSILDGNFQEYKESFLSRYKLTNKDK